MAVIINDRDEVLSAASIRLNKINSDYISVVSDTPNFTRNGSSVTPASITLTFALNGRLYGTPTITTNNISSVTTTYPTSTTTQVVVQSSNIGSSSSTCSVTATLNLWGNTYSVTATVSDSSVAPAAISQSNITIAPEGTLLRMSWPQSPEVDIAGYEVRDSDSNWGAGSGYLYNGSVTSCTLTPGALGVAKTFYIRAYDKSKLYSTTSSKSYTVAAPTAPTGLSASFSTTSATTSTVTLTWNNTQPLFGLYSYTVDVTIPLSGGGNTIVTKVTNTPSLVIDSSWVGNASATVKVTDLLGNTSAASTSYIITKSAPNNISTPISISTVGTKLLLDWTEPSKTSLPIIGYEVRTSDSGWGNNSYVWRGLVSECQVSPGVLNSTTNYYVKAIDSDNIYSTSTTATSYQVTAPPDVSTVSHSFSTGSTGQSTVTVKWNIPSGQTFGIKVYRITLTKPDASVITADVSADSWTTTADWEGRATVVIKTVDVLDSVSAGYTYYVQKVPINVGNSTFTTKNVQDTVELTWTTPTPTRTGIAWVRSGTTATFTDNSHGYTVGTVITISQSSSTAAIPVNTYAITSVTTNTYNITCLNGGATSGTATNNTPFSLLISSYEIRASDNSTVLYRGSANTAVISKQYITSTTLSWYLYAIDSAGKYSSNSKNGTTTLSLPGTVTGLVASAVSENTSLVTFSWTAPVTATDQFLPSKYRLVLSRSGKSDVTAVVNSTFWSYKPDWAGSAATLKVYTVDLVDFESATATSLSVTIDKPDQPGVITFSTSGKSVILKWPQNSKSSSQLPLVGYEIRDTNDPDQDWGSSSASLLWRGSSTTATLSAAGLVASIEPYDFFIRAYDTYGNYSTTRQSNFTVSLPSAILAANISYSYDNSSIGGTTVNTSWTTPASTYDIDYYTITLARSGKTDVVVKTYSNNYRFDVDWTGDATVTVVATDVLGNVATGGTAKTLAKVAPGAPSFVSVAPVSKALRLTWGAGTAGSIGIAGYEVRDTNSGWGDSSYIWKGNSLFVDIANNTAGDKTWYVKSYDLFGQYSALALTTTTYTVVAPGQPSVPTATFSDTATTSALVTFSWSSTKNTFDIDRYAVTLTKPGNIVKSITLNSTSWTTDADWTGDATLSIQAFDEVGNSSTARTATITKTVPQAPSAGTHTASTDGILFKWAASVAGSLGISGYEVRDFTTSAVLWRGTALNYLKSSGIVEGDNKVIVYAYDTDGEYSTSGTTLTYTTIKPSTVTFPTPTIEWSSSLTTATARLKWNTPSTSVFGTQYYDVEFVTTTPARTITSRRSTTDWEVPADWTGSGTMKVIATDYMGISSVQATTTVAKVAPNQPGAVTKTAESGTTIELDWPDVATTSLPIAGYVLRTDQQDSNPGLATGLLFKGNTSGTVVDLQEFNLVPGNTKTFYLYGYDTGNQFSAVRTYTYTVTAPQNTTSLTARFEDTNLTSATVVLNWDPVTPSFGLKHYQITGELSVTGTTTAGGATITMTSTKGIRVGDTVTGTYISTPRTVVTVTTTQITLDGGTGVTAGTGTMTFYASEYSNTTTVTLPADWLGSKTFRVKTINTIGWSSTGATVSITKNVPNSASNLRAQVIDNTVLLYWTLPAITSLPLSHALIKKGASWAAGEVIGEKSGSFTTITELQGGVYTYWLAMIDTDNNESTPVQLTTTVSAPPDYIFNAEYKSSFTGYNSNAITEPNTGALVLPVNLTETFQSHFSTPGWAGPSAQVSAGYPVYIQPGLSTGYYEEVFDYGTALGASQVSLSINGATVVGTINRTVVISTSNSSTTTALGGVTGVTVSATGTTNARGLVTISGTAITGTLPTVGAAVVLRGISTTTPTGYENQVNMPGVVISASTTSVVVKLYRYTGPALSSVTLTTASTVSYIATTWTDFADATSAFATNFRYIKVRITCTQGTAGAIYKINSLLVRLDAKQRTDSGSVTTTLGGAHPQASISPDYYTLWTVGSLPSSGFPRNGGDAANLVLLGTAPSGNQETIWACVDNDIANDGDGGWEGSYFSIDPTKPHVFAVFMKTTTNNGDSYWGLHTNGTGDTLTLAGASNTNPYFWNGDLPALNTWYLILGLVHETGYGTTDLGISGIYDLSGVKQVAATEYKFPNSTTTAMHRCYHYYNVTGSGSQVQFMARPVVIKLSGTGNVTTEATNIKNYLLDCATKQGAQVIPSTSFVDVTSITTTTQGTVLATPVVDFYDIPNPKRFNIFNYNSSGVLTSGTVSWTVRGY